jgi:hypothetical protein
VRSELLRRAVEFVATVFHATPVPSLHGFRSLVAAKLSVAVEFSAGESGFARIGKVHQQYFAFPLEGALRD